MNSQQAKHLSLPAILAKLGFDPVKSAKEGNELWYLSPFRAEKEASFHTSFLGGKWIWKDFGDMGGTVIDFAMRFQNTDLKGALAFLSQIAPRSSKFSKPFQPQHETLPEENDLFTPRVRQRQPESSENRLVFGRERPLQTTVGYIQGRGIGLAIAKRYLVEIFFSNSETKKEYYAVGIKNRAGGYEIRNPYFKSSLGAKDITLIKGRLGQSVGVFEGFMDFLSYLTDIKTDESERDAIILNSASFEKAALELIKSKGYQKVHLFFDNDKTGHGLTASFIESLDGVAVQPENHRYHPHKDYNEYLQSKFKSISK
ncbi:MAG: toprim domain-containing protein [Saprospiraceae bacterium]